MRETELTRIADRVRRHLGEDVDEDQLRAEINRIAEEELDNESDEHPEDCDCSECSLVADLERPALSQIARRPGDRLG